MVNKHAVILYINSLERHLNTRIGTIIILYAKVPQQEKWNLAYNKHENIKVSKEKNKLQ